MSNRLIAMTIVVGLASGAALAQTSRDPAPGTTLDRSAAPATRTDATVPPVSGANSFTEAEARNRIEKSGYSGVSGLTKDSQGIWRGNAMKDGNSVGVALDFKGNVVPMAQNAQVPSSMSPVTAPTGAPAPTR